MHGCSAWGHRSKVGHPKSLTSLRPKTYNMKGQTACGLSNGQCCIQWIVDGCVVHLFSPPPRWKGSFKHKHDPSNLKHPQITKFIWVKQKHHATRLRSVFTVLYVQLCTQVWVLKGSKFHPFPTTQPLGLPSGLHLVCSNHLFPLSFLLAVTLSGAPSRPRRR